MSEIVLSGGVRSNLLQLQNTADLISRTQTRLATGKKVNSALDNPTNFFTASSLNARASDLANLLDSQKNAIKTLEAADNGLKAITKTVESLQSTVRQARQDNSFKSKELTIDSAATGNLSISGGALTGTETVALATTATATTLTGSGANFGTDFTGGTITVNGTNVTIRGDTAATAATLTGAGGSDLTGDPDLSALDGESVSISDGTNTVTYNFTNAASGQGAALDTALNASGFTVTRTNAGINVSRADGANFTVTTSNGAVDTAIGIANNTASTDGVAAFDATAATVIADFNGAGITGLTASDSSGQVALSLASGADLTLAGGDTLLTAIGFGTSNRTSTNGTEAGVQSVDALVTAITNNANLAAAGVKASNTDGKLKITFESTSSTDLTIGGLNTAGDTATGGAGSATVKGNEIRRNLETQFNELRNQLNKLAEDASFNGINLLQGDQLKVVFNENNTSSLTVQSSNTNGVNTTTLGITQVTSGSFASNTTLDSRLASLGDALGTLRSQASSFGSNLSIVENRQEFTKSTINTLQSGADNLTLADLNEEGANLLALQTRQQLSTTALSLAAQADQNVLRLF